MENKYPDISTTKLAGLDIETYDPELKKLGPGTLRKDGCVLGVALSTAEGFKHYYNLNHKGISAEEKAKNFAYLEDMLSRPFPKVGAHILYDLEWLNSIFKKPIAGAFDDVLIAEPLLDEEYQLYNLDNVARKRLGKGKVKSKPELFCEEHGLKGDFREWLYMMPYDLVYDYVIGDVDLPLEIIQLQKKELERAQLMRVYDLEIRQFPLLLQMRKQGVRIDERKVAENATVIIENLSRLRKELGGKYKDLNIKSSKQLAEILDEEGIQYKHNAPTEKMLEKGILQGNPNLDRDALEELAIKYDNPMLTTIVRIREAEHVLSTFFYSAFSEQVTSGRIHATFNQLRSDENYGTISGRYSCSKPNLQQIPKKSNKDLPPEFNYKELCRSVFIPEEGKLWGKLDWSQIEYRFISHYATGEGAEEIREAYRRNPKTDYHQLIMDRTQFDRENAKRLNFGAAYFLGVDSAARKFGWSKEESSAFMSSYFENVPFMKPTRQAVVAKAKERGYIKTILGRRRRVTERIRTLGKEYSLFNGLIQGSAAELMKTAMAESHEAGVFEVLDPHIIVHDEFDVSVSPNKEGKEAFLELQHIMENCIELSIPIIAEPELGKNWNDLRNPEDVWKELDLL